jgi:hypothetical protein
MEFDLWTWQEFLVFYLTFLLVYLILNEMR